MEEALFYTVLHRLTERGSDLQASKWRTRVYDPLCSELRYHHFIRAMGYAAEFKEEVEEELFRYERDLFSCELDLVFLIPQVSILKGKGLRVWQSMGIQKITVLRVNRWL